MSSLKMTFSLASLVLILGLVFVTTPVMAQIDQIAGLGTATVTPVTGMAENLSVTGGIIPANGHLVLYRAENAAAAGLPANLPTGAVFHQWENMPNLEELFFGNAGGTIALKGTKTALDGTTRVGSNEYRFDHDRDDQFPDSGAGVHAEGDGSGDGNKDKTVGTTVPTANDDPVVAATADRDVAVNDAAITEIMWGLDNATAGAPTVDDRQWIEIHNRLSVDLPVAGLIIHIKSGRPGVDQISKDDVPTVHADGTVTTQGRTVLDWFSNVDGNGWGASPPGENGFTTTDVANIANRIDLVSMYRNRGKLGKTEGTNLGHWIASTNTYLAGYKGTPGAAERTGPKRFSASGVSLDIVFNEVANHSNAKYEWFELLNPDGDLPHFENWRIHIVTGVDKQKELLTFPKLNTGRYDDILLVTKTDPALDKDHPLAKGYNVSVDFAKQEQQGRDKNVRYYVAGDRWKEAMPSDEFILILRNGKDKTNHEKVVDVAGYVASLKKSTADFESSQWPLRGHGAPASDKNQFTEGTVHRRQHVGTIGTGTTHGDKKDGQVAYIAAGWTGLGYKRNTLVADANEGTPGYPNGAQTGSDADPTGSVIVSEIMPSKGDRNLPEWIELLNTSKTMGVNVNGWRITIQNHDEDGAGGTFDGDLSVVITISDGEARIPPGQTFLIAARRGRDATELPSARIHAHNNLRSELLINLYGFNIKVETKEKDGKRFLADEIGNLAEAPAKARNNAASFEPITWEWPASINEDGDRVSIIRVSGKTKGVLPGTMEDAWTSFAGSGQDEGTYDPTSFGHESDIGSPGHTAGGVLPVSLSKFRPERMKDTGEIVVRWITESETNNAGFNILRSETRDGEFTKLNTKLIAGQGTTSARTIYKFADTSAKPNVVYYYQIQDVSLDGKVQTLRTTHLRGNVTAAGKLTTTWAELKALQ